MRWTIKRNKAKEGDTKEVRRFAWFPVIISADHEQMKIVWFERYTTVYNYRPRRVPIKDLSTLEKIYYRPLQEIPEYKNWFYENGDLKKFSWVTVNKY